MKKPETGILEASERVGKRRDNNSLDTTYGDRGERGDRPGDPLRRRFLIGIG